MVVKNIFKVKIGETGKKGTISQTQLICNWQEATSQFLQTIGATGFQLHKIGYAWVINGFTAHFSKNLPCWGSEYCVETWARNNKNIKLLRDFKIKDMNDNMLCYGTSAWAVIDIKTRKPVIYSKFEKSLKISTETVLPETVPGKFEWYENSLPYTSLWEVKDSDLDANIHANNIKYMEAYQNSLPQKSIKGKYLSKFSIQYKKELFLGDKVDIVSYEKDGNFYQKMVRQVDRAIVSVAKAEYV